MRRLAYTRAAVRDFAAILNYISQKSGKSELAVRHVEALRAQCQHLAALPGVLGRPRDSLSPGLRSFPYRGYVILFRYEPERLLVVNVIEGHRDIAALQHDEK